MSPNKIPDASALASPPETEDSGNMLPEPDIQIVTSGGICIPAHRSVLALASPVLESIIDRPRKHRRSEPSIPILGVPCDAVSVFIRFLYSFKCTDEEMDKYGIHLLTLSHMYLVPQLKRRCTKDLIGRLTLHNVVDILQLSRLCDAPDLYLKSIKLVSNNFKAVEKTDDWKFVQDHDPWLELEILQFIDETELRKRRTRRQRIEQRIYIQLHEAMECLEHICTEGCTSVGPHDMDPTNKRTPCGKFATCQGIQHLIKHFATCKKRVNGGCSRCKRMWQIFRLHSCVCDNNENCRVPLCRQFKLKAHERKGENERWRLLARRVLSAKAMSSLSLPKRKREEKGRVISCDDRRTRSFMF